MGEEDMCRSLAVLTYGAAAYVWSFWLCLRSMSAKREKKMHLDLGVEDEVCESDALEAGSGMRVYLATVLHTVLYRTLPT